MKTIISKENVSLRFNNPQEAKDFVKDYGEKNGAGHWDAWEQQFGDPDEELVDYPASAWGKKNDWCVVSFDVNDRINNVYCYCGKKDSPYEELLERGIVYLVSTRAWLKAQG